MKNRAGFRAFHRPSRILLLVALLAISDESALAQSELPEPTVLWTQQAGLQPIDIKSGDLNHDGKPDFVVGYSESNIRAIDSDGDILWDFPAQEWVHYVATGDIDGDGQDDVAALESQRPSTLYAITGLGAELWNYQLPNTGSGAIDLVQIGNVFGDSNNEVLGAAAVPGTLFIFDSQGAVERTYSPPSFISTIQLGDLTGDGLLDVVITYGFRCPPCGIQAIDGAGQLLWNLPTPTRFGDVAIGDITGDGQKEVVAIERAGGSGPDRALAIDAVGRLLWEFEVAGGLRSVALGDLNDDGVSEVVVGFLKKIQVLSGNGVPVWSFNVGEGGAGEVQAVFKVAIGDLDGDGIGEVAVGTLNCCIEEAGIYVLDSNGSPMWFYPAAVPPPTENPQRGFRDLVVVDLDNNGREEVVGIQDDTGNGELGLVIALETPPEILSKAVKFNFLNTDGGPNYSGRIEQVASDGSSGREIVMDVDPSLYGFIGDWKGFAADNTYFYFLNTEGGPNYAGRIERVAIDGSTGRELVMDVQPSLYGYIGDWKGFAADKHYFYFLNTEGGPNYAGRIERVAKDGSTGRELVLDVDPSVYGFITDWKGFATDGQFFYFLNTQGGPNYAGRIDQLSMDGSVYNAGILDVEPSLFGSIRDWKGFAATPVF